MANKKKKKRTAPRPPSSSPTARPTGPRQAATKQAPVKPTRSERILAAQRQRRRQRLVRRGLLLGALLLAVGIVVSLIISNQRASERTISRLEAGGCQYDTRADSDAGQGRNHVAGSPTYRVNPPAGGNHLAAAARPTAYTGQVPPDGQVVHAMEHGDIVLWHKPDVAPDVVAQMRELVDKYDGDVLVVPRPSLPTPVAATAWHRRLLCPGFERRPIELFIQNYRDKGPEKVEEE